MSESSSREPALLQREQAGHICAQASIPPVILEVTRRLQAEGYASLLVGGAVRDCLLGRAVGDWDLATSATPTEVMALFRRTIPTGVEHGTVTVLVGRDEDRHAVEVTTFRGESSYQDGRRPEEVTFLRDVREDLKRRDFTVNAFAFDPITGAFYDEFDGLGDLHRGVIRAVGDPLARFSEDGLRVIRGLRFCATLGFELEQETFRAIEPRLHVFEKVARERVRVELFKLLGAPAPSTALEAMASSRLWERVLPPVEDRARSDLMRWVDEAEANVLVRLAMLLRAGAPGGTPTVAKALDDLKLSRAERRRCDALVGPLPNALLTTDSVVIRRTASLLGREYVEDACAVLAVDTASRTRILNEVGDAPLSTKELRISGGELIKEGLVIPGPGVRDVLQVLLEWTFEDPGRNTKDTLRAHAKDVLTARGGAGD